MICLFEIRILHMENQTIQKTKSNKVTKIILGIILLIVAIYSINNFLAEVSPDHVNLMIKVKGKSYIYSEESTKELQKEIDQKKTPGYSSSTFLYKDDDLYIEPQQMMDFIHLLSNNLVYFSKKEPSFDGYVTADTLTTYILNTTTKNTSTIGEQIEYYEVVLPYKKKKMSIQWSNNSKTGESKALKNCELHTFHVSSSSSSGKNSVSSMDYIVVPLKTLETFYNKKYEYKEEEKLIIIQ